MSMWRKTYNLLAIAHSNILQLNTERNCLCCLGYLCVDIYIFYLEILIYDKDEVENGFKRTNAEKNHGMKVHKAIGYNSDNIY